MKDKPTLGSYVQRNIWESRGKIIKVDGNIRIVEYASGYQEPISEEELRGWIVIGQGEMATGWGNIPTKSKQED